MVIKLRFSRKCRFLCFINVFCDFSSFSPLLKIFKNTYTLIFELIFFVVLFGHSRDNPTNFQVIWSSFEYTFSFTLCYVDTTRINVFWCMTRGNPSDLQPIDPEIDRTFHRGLRHLRNLSLHADYFVSFPDSSDSPHSHDTHHSVHSLHSEHTMHSDRFDFHTDNMAQSLPHERTTSELIAPEFTYGSLCIQYPEEEIPYVLKTGLIHLLPKFHGLVGEDPYKHLKQFHVVCSTTKPVDVQEDHVYLKGFPHSLEGNAKD